MDTGRVKDGVEKRAKSIRIHFDYLGKRRRETLKILPSANNLRFAKKKRAQILYEIETGQFNYAAHFPNSKNAILGRPQNARTVDDYHAIWQSTLTIAKSTKKGYDGCYRRYIKGQFGPRPVDMLPLSELKAWKVDLEANYSPKTVNNALIVMRGILACAYGDEVIRRDLAGMLSNVTTPTDKTHVDPFDIEEINALSAAFDRLHMPQQRNLVEFWFSAGLRPGEIMALEWDDVDWINGRIQVARSWVMKERKTTKTARVRHVDLLGRALPALQRQRACTQLSGSLIFPNPNTMRQWCDHEALRKRFIVWCTLAKVRPRPPKQLRHTYGSMMLSAGEPPIYVMEQMGHTTLRMLERHYAKWMRSANRKAGDAFSTMANG